MKTTTSEKKNEIRTMCTSRTRSTVKACAEAFVGKGNASFNIHVMRIVLMMISTPTRMKCCLSFDDRCMLFNAPHSMKTLYQ